MDLFKKVNEIFLAFSICVVLIFILCSHKHTDRNRVVTQIQTEIYNALEIYENRDVSGRYYLYFGNIYDKDRALDQFSSDMAYQIYFVIKDDLK